MPGRRVVEEMPSCSANESRRIWRRNKLAFLDEEAAATRTPAPLTAMMNRSASE